MRIEHVDPLSDADLRILNSLLDWHCYTVDGQGRRFGNSAWTGKREEPQTIPDPRIQLLNDRVDLRGRRVLEVGCFEGIHTVGLCQAGALVTAIDSRIENVAKTIVRCGMYGCHCTVFVCDVENIHADAARLAADWIVHIGVLYHLRDPVSHLMQLGQYGRMGVFLDTHYCHDVEADDTYEALGERHRYFRYVEHGRRDVFSGMHDHAKWLCLSDIVALLYRAGFDQVEMVEQREERHGPRSSLLAWKSTATSTLRKAGNGVA